MDTESTPPMYFAIAEWAEERVYDGMPPAANHVLRYLVAHALVGKAYWHTTEYGRVDTRWSQVAVIARQTGLSVRTVTGVMRDLQYHGKIIRVRQSQVTGELKAGNPYVVSLMPLIDGLFSSPNTH